MRDGGKLRTLNVLGELPHLPVHPAGPKAAIS
jgi:hypothetical protein